MDSRNGAGLRKLAHAALETFSISAYFGSRFARASAARGALVWVRRNKTGKKGTICFSCLRRAITMTAFPR
jgi:hypothetical protein